jgi:PhzF family phenazine biosynthesis protein
MGTKIYQVDAFSNKPFSGNPAAVCILPEPVNQDWARKIAAEMNLAETAFLNKEGDGYNLRWFTPTVEVDLCGHATLASAHILWEQNLLERDQVARFYTKSGLLTAKISNGWIELNFPSKPATEIEPPEGLLEALGVKAKFVGVNKFDYIVEVESEEIVRKLDPDHMILRKLPVRGVIVTSQSHNEEFDFVSRFFAPGSGIDEDPVTGSAHCCLGPYWKNILGKDKFTAYQASKRGGIIRVKVDEDRVYLGGQAITVLRGELWD